MPAAKPAPAINCRPFPPPLDPLETFGLPWQDTPLRIGLVYEAALTVLRCNPAFVSALGLALRDLVRSPADAEAVFDFLRGAS